MSIAFPWQRQQKCLRFHHNAPIFYISTFVGGVL